MTIRAELVAEVARAGWTSAEIAHRLGRAPGQVAAHLKFAYDDGLVDRRPVSGRAGHTKCAWTYFVVDGAVPALRRPTVPADRHAYSARARRINTRRLPVERAQE